MRNISLLVAIGVNQEGFREILGNLEGAKEDKAGWRAFLKHLKARGLSGVALIISDACLGLVESAVEFYAQAQWQRCAVHFNRNIFSHVPSTKACEMAHMLKAIHAQESRQAAARRAAEVIASLKAVKFCKAAEQVESHMEETFSSYAFLDQH